MVRRLTIDRDPPVTPPAVTATTAVPDAGRRQGATIARTRWPGAGGRWLIWVFRVALWAVLLVVGYRGVMAIVLNETPSGAPSPTVTRTAEGFPTQLASAFALQFAQVYLSASPATAGERARELATFLPPGADSRLGWNGAGSLALQSAQPAGVSVRDSHHAVVSVLARVNGRLMELGVPVYAASGGITVSGEPAWLPPPARSVPPTPAAPPASDAATQQTLLGQLPAFFTAYASDDQVTLARYTAPGSTIAGLAGAVTFGSVSSVFVPPGGQSRHAVVTVVWRVPEGAAATLGQARLEMSYRLAIVKRNGTWYIQNLSPASQAGGPP